MTGDVLLHCQARRQPNRHPISERVLSRLIPDEAKFWGSEELILKFSFTSRKGNIIPQSRGKEKELLLCVVFSHFSDGFEDVAERRVDVDPEKHDQPQVYKIG